MAEAPIRILYVDDDEDLREIAVMSLELDPGFDVRACPSGPAALPQARDWQPALILLDVMMPGMDGPETLHHLRSAAETAHIPIVFITARTHPPEVTRLLSLGARAVIAKPFDPIALAGQVRELLQPA